MPTSKSLKSTLSKMNPFKKTHDYNTQADLDNLTAEEIIKLSPSKIGTYITDENNPVSLTGDKKRAMLQLLSIKKMEKKTPSLKTRRNYIVNNFMDSIGKSSKTNTVINSIMDELVQENNKKLSEAVEFKRLTQRLDRLNDRKETPFTAEEKLYIRMNDIGMGIRKKNKTKKRRNISNRKKSLRNFSLIKKRKTGTRHVKKH
jgi:hypothetical protein